MAIAACRFVLHAACAAAILVAPGVAVAASPVSNCALPARAAGNVPSNVRSADPQLRLQLMELAAGSQIARDMLDEIGQAPQSLVLLRVNPRLAVDERLDGLSTAGLADGALVVRVEVDNSGSPEHRRAVLAHELAHVVEFVSLPRLPARSLASMLMAREGHHAPWSSAQRLETAFAQAIEQAVANELGVDRPLSTGQFRRLAKNHGVDLTAISPVVPCGSPMAAAR